MDDHFESHHDRYHGNGQVHGHGHGDAFHRHSQSTSSTSSNQLDLDFSAMMQPTAHLGPGHQSPADASRLSAASATTYESHDDLCVDRCMGVGLYNGFQQFNHRGAPPSLPARWARDNPLARYDFSMGHMELSMQFRPADLAPPAPVTPTLYPQQWYGQHLDPCAPCAPCDPCDPCDPCVPCIPCTDDDCQSVADSCCDSQCTMTDKCTDVACADTDDACTDQSCPSRPSVVVPSSEVVSGAAALISINHAPEELQHHNFDLQQQQQGEASPSLTLICQAVSLIANPPSYDRSGFQPS